MIVTLYYFAFAVALFFMLRLASRLAKTILTSKKYHKVILRGFPIFELAVWGAFVLWVVNQALGSSEYATLATASVLIIFLLIISWFFLRDFIAGIILKTEFPFEVNQRIAASNFDGSIKRLGYRSLELEKDNGDIVKIPYSLIASRSIHLQNMEDSLRGHETLVKASTKIPVQTAKDIITKEVLLTPWATTKQVPTIRVVEQTDQTNTYSVHFHSVSSKYAASISQHLKTVFDSKSDEDKS
ncbi:MAG: mechanosensitive ion channel [Bacteroidales bacterium]|nr:mechanosensitive ion channel [Bacteroidales bacterium]MDD3890952.1 mechanosensitive ion channel [Bacteroidales bacterium]